MKRIIAFILAAAMAFCCNVYADEYTKVNLIIEGQAVDTDSSAIIYNSRTMVPIRVVAEKLGTEIEWDGDSKTVTFRKDGVTTLMTVGRKELVVNGKTVATDTPAVIINSRTMVPIAFLTDNFGYDVEWDGGTKTVSVSAAKGAVTDTTGFIEENYDEGDRYFGEFKNGLRDGNGIYTFADGNVYEGEWKEGKFEGYGTFKFANGSVYKGEFSNGMFDGQGTLTYDNGEVYTGEFKQDCITGKGVYTWPNGDRYEGDFIDKERTGYGKYTWGPNSEYSGDVYEGEFVNGVLEGQGTMTYGNGDVYSGEWKNGSITGQGKYTDRKGNVVEGQWENGNFLG